MVTHTSTWITPPSCHRHLKCFTHVLVLANCPNGQEYDLSAGQCVDCAQGFYRSRNLQDVCVICPDENFVTTGPGDGIAVSACTLRKFITQCVCLIVVVVVCDMLSIWPCLKIYIGKFIYSKLHSGELRRRWHAVHELPRRLLPAAALADDVSVVRCEHDNGEHRHHIHGRLLP